MPKYHWAGVSSSQDRRQRITEYQGCRQHTGRQAEPNIQTEYTMKSDTKYAIYSQS